MKWAEIRIHTTNEAIEPISYILNESGASGVAIEDPQDLIIDREALFGEIFELNRDDYPEEGVYVKAYLPENPSFNKKVEEIKEAIGNLKTFQIDIGKNEITIHNVDEEEWSTAWKKYYKPIQVSDRITIKPTWEHYEPMKPSELIIELDPGMAFGTGSHPTTILSIQALEKYLEQDDQVIDVGCGSGVLSIASALLGANQVIAFDLDEIAVKSTKQNVETNKVSKVVESKQNNLLEDVSEQVDVIVSNILAEIILRFVEDAWKNLKPNGLFITSGIIQSKKQDVMDGLEQQGFQILEINELDDWVSIIAQKK